MNDVFDPETVERWLDENEHHIRLEVVKAEDYDKLLGAYGLVCELLKIEQNYADTPVRVKQ